MPSQQTWQRGGRRHDVHRSRITGSHASLLRHATSDSDPQLQPPRAYPATRRRRLVVPWAAVTKSSSGKQTDKWAEFASRVSGEWDGFGAEFTAGGDPVELPENVVPEAYRDWGVQVFDWQTQCPTFADPAAPCALQYRLVRLLPTVGCEADAATVHTSHQRHALSASAFAYGTGGSYVAEWPNGPAPVLEVEHCIVHPDNKEVRVRLVQTVALAKEARLRGVKVFSEQWYGPYRNGDQLGGCALRETGFAAGEKLPVSDVLGQWESKDASAARFSDELDPETGKFAGLTSDEPGGRSFRQEHGIVPLPKQLWSLFHYNGDDEFVCEVGWVLGHGNAVTSRFVYSVNLLGMGLVAAHITSPSIIINQTMFKIYLFCNM